jgi:hypothetical protein
MTNAAQDILDRFQPDHRAFSPWYGRPKRLHANDCPVWMANHHNDWVNCCPPRYNIINIPDMDAVPRGFIQPYAPHPHLAAVAQAEIDYIASTQHAPDCMNRRNQYVGCCEPPDLAPDSMLMHERGMEAVAIDSLSYSEEGDHPLEITNDDFDGIMYHNPPRLEQALAEWERRSWLNGPIERYKLTLEDGHVSLMLQSIQHQGGATIHSGLSNEEKNQLLADIASRLQAEDRIPTAEELTADLEMVAALREEWGSKWHLHNPVHPGINPHPFEMADMDDPYRYEFHNEDTRHEPGTYDSPATLSYDLDDDIVARNHTVVVVASGSAMLGLYQDAALVPDDDLSNLPLGGVGL